MRKRDQERVKNVKNVIYHDFLESGVEGVSIRKVADECNCSTQVIYTIFSSREEIEEYNIDRSLNRFKELLEKNSYKDYLIHLDMALLRCMTENKGLSMSFFSKTKYSKMIRDKITTIYYEHLKNRQVIEKMSKEEIEKLINSNINFITSLSTLTHNNFFNLKHNELENIVEDVVIKFRKINALNDDLDSMIN